MEWLRQIYRVRVLQDVGSGNGLVNRVNRVPIYQSIFQQSNRLPVHLRGRYDGFIYGALMTVAFSGTLLTVLCLGNMATGTMKKV